jgi:hypothetical protein
MDPEPLANVEWTNIGRLLTHLWISVGLVVFIATNLLAGHIVIPSLVASKHIPEMAQKSRPAFYALAILSFAAVIYVFHNIYSGSGIDLRSVIDTVWSDYWI